MATPQGSSAQTIRKKKDKGSRRAWSEREEQVLLACLKELITKGWKTENGMRAGYMKKLEIGLRRVFPDTDLKADPHVSSRIQVWKKNYASLVTILSTSGVGFNVNGDNMVECDEEQWESFIQVDSNAAKIRKRAWPLFEGWKEVFGKDRATGEVAEDVVDAVDNLCSDNVEASDGNTAEKTNLKSNQQATQLDGDDISVCQSSKDETNTSARKKKKKVDEKDTNMCALLEQIHKDTNVTLQTIAAHFAPAANLSEARKHVFELIKALPGLSSKDQFVVCDKLLSSPARLEFFMALSEASRTEYVCHMLMEA